MDSNNMKALYRRGVALKENCMYSLAELDFKSLLEQDEGNKSAKEQLKQMKQMRLSKPENKNVLIEEIKSDEIETPTLEMDKKYESTKCTRMKIEEIITTENTEKLTNINYSSSDEDESISQLPAKVKKMLHINKTQSRETDQMDKIIDEIEKKPIRETKRHEQKIKIIEECKQLPPNSSNTDKNRCHENLSVHDNNVPNKNTSYANFVTAHIEDVSANNKASEKFNKCQPDKKMLKQANSTNKVVDLKTLAENAIKIISETDKNRLLPQENILQTNKAVSEYDVNMSAVQDTTNHDAIDNKLIDGDSKPQILSNVNLRKTDEIISSESLNLKRFKEMKNEEYISNDDKENRKSEIREKTDEESENEFIDVENLPQIDPLSILKSQKWTEEYGSDNTNSRCKTDNKDCQLVENSQSTNDSPKIFEEKMITNGSFSNCSTEKTVYNSETLYEQGMNTSMEDMNKSETYEETYIESSDEDTENEYIDIEYDFPLQETSVQKSRERIYECELDYKNSRSKISKDCKDLDNSQSTFNMSKLFHEGMKCKDCFSNCTKRKSTDNETLDEPGMELISKDAEIAMLENKQYQKVTPYEFLCTWCFDDDGDVKIRALNLLKLKAEELPQIISNKLEASMLMGILKAIGTICRMGKYVEGGNYLYYLTQVSRINIAAMFLTKEEIKSIQDLFSTLDCEHGFYMKYVNMILLT